MLTTISTKKFSPDYQRGITLPSVTKFRSRRSQRKVEEMRQVAKTAGQLHRSVSLLVQTLGCVRCIFCALGPIGSMCSPLAPLCPPKAPVAGWLL